MDMEFRKRVAQEQGIDIEQVLFGVCNGNIVWDNCEGGFVTMARTGEVVLVTKHDSDDSLSAYFDYGDHIISDYVGVDVRLVGEDEARLIDMEYRDKLERDLARRRIERDDFDGYDVEREHYVDDDFDF